MTLQISPGQSLSVDINPERVHTRDQHIHPQVELQLVDEGGGLDVALNTQLGLLVWNFFKTVHHSDSHPAEKIWRLDNPEVVWVIFHMSGNFLPVRWKDVGQWHEPEIFLPELLPHNGVVPVQIVLPSQLGHGGELVDLHHLVELTEVHHVAVLLRDWKRVPDCSIANVALELSDPSLKCLRLFLDDRLLDNNNC